MFILYTHCNTFTDMSQYQKSCSTCKQQIEMSDRNAGKWLPFNLDGTLHTCRGNQTGTQKVETNSKPLSLEDLDARLRKVERVVLDPRK
jgi:hypothetical protein